MCELDIIIIIWKKKMFSFFLNYFCRGNNDDVTGQRSFRRALLAFFSLSNRLSRWLLAVSNSSNRSDTSRFCGKRKNGGKKEKLFHIESNWLLLLHRVFVCFILLIKFLNKINKIRYCSIEEWRAGCRGKLCFLFAHFC